MRLGVVITVRVGVISRIKIWVKFGRWALVRLYVLDGFESLLLIRLSLVLKSRGWGALCVQ